MIKTDVKERTAGYLRRLFGKSARVPSDSVNIFAFEACFRFIVSFFLSRVRVAKLCSPFGLSFAAQGGSDIPGLCGVLGACIGYILSGANVGNARYVVSTAGAFFALVFLRRFAIGKRSWFPPLFIPLFHGLTAYLVADDGASVLAAALDEILCLICCFAFRLVTEPREESGTYGYGVSVAVFVSLVCAGASSPPVFGILGIGRLFAVVLLMAVTYRCGADKAVPFSVILGTVFDVSFGKGLFFSFIYPFAVLTSLFFMKRGRLPFALWFVSASGAAAFLLPSHYFRLACLYEVFGAAVIFLMVPPSAMARFAALFPADKNTGGIVRSRAYIRDRIETASEAFRLLYTDAKALLEHADAEESIGAVIDNAAETACRRCKNIHACWSVEYERTKSVMNGITKPLTERGFVTTDDFPVYFIEKCMNPALLVSAVSGEYRAYLYRKQYRASHRESLSAAYAGYADLYLIMKHISEELSSDGIYDRDTEKRVQGFLRAYDIPLGVSAFKDVSGRLHIEFEGDSAYRLMRLQDWLDILSEQVGLRLCTTGEIRGDRLTVLEAEPYSVSVGVSSLAAERDGTGDTGRFFKTENGILYVILSDGLGTGASAEKMSRETIRILELFLRAGFPPETALRILSDAMLLKNEADIYSATVDLLCIDLFTGSARIYKSGAAPSYIQRGNSVRRIRCKSPLPGFLRDDEFSPDTAQIQFAPSSRAVIVSDGILGDEDDSWLTVMLSDCTDTPTAIARKITEESLRRYGKNDDMTAICVCFEKRK